LKAQLRSVEANGKKINFEISSNKPEDSPKFYIGARVDIVNAIISTIGERGTAGMTGLELAYSSKFFKVNANLYRTNYGVEAIIAPFHIYKTKSKHLFLMQERTGYKEVTRYVTDVDMVVRNSFGFHFGFNRLDYSAGNYNEDYLGTDPDYDSDSSSDPYNFTYATFDGLDTKEVFVGMAFINTKSIKAVVVLNKPRKTGGVKEFGIYTDVIMYTDTKTNIPDPLSFVGLRTYLDYYSGFYMKNTSFGWVFKIGAQYGPIVYNVMPIFNFGFKVGL
jgi:hypothetical protein